VQEVTLDSERRLLIVRPRGNLDLEYCFELFARIRRQEGDERFDRFIDLSGVTDVDLSFDEVRRLAGNCSAYWSDGPKARCAVHAEREILFGVARMFQSLMETDRLDVGVCRTCTAAAVSLGVPPELLENAAEA